MSGRVCPSCGSLAPSEEALKCDPCDRWRIDPEVRDRVGRDALLGSALDGRFPIVGVLGEGGFGTVYRGLQVADGTVLREVAIKLLHPATSDSGVAAARFRREAAAIASVDHPNIVQMHDFGVAADGTWFMVLALIRGHTLKRVFRQENRLSAERVGRIFRQILQALSVAHEAGLVHRDLKPENVMLSCTSWEPDFVTVLDFGLAKVRQGSGLSELTKTGMTFGTPYYMAPEQVSGEQVDARTDLYSTGVLLYLALAGQRPYESDSATTVLFKHIYEDLPPLPGDVSPGLRSVVYRALQKRPHQRFADARSMLHALDSALADPAREVPGGELPRALPHPGQSDADLDVDAQPATNTLSEARTDSPAYTDKVEGAADHSATVQSSLLRPAVVFDFGDGDGDEPSLELDDANASVSPVDVRPAAPSVPEYDLPPDARSHPALQVGTSPDRGHIPVTVVPPPSRRVSPLLVVVIVAMGWFGFQAWERYGPATRCAGGVAAPVAIGSGVAAARVHVEARRWTETLAALESVGPDAPDVDEAGRLRAEAMMEQRNEKLLAKVQRLVVDGAFDEARKVARSVPASSVYRADADQLLADRSPSR